MRPLQLTWHHWCIVAIVGLTSGVSYSTAAQPPATYQPASGAITIGQHDPMPLLREFVKPGADHAALAKKLRPSTKDLQAIFSDELAAALEKAYAPAWDSGVAFIAPKPGQTVVRLKGSATTDEIIKWTGGAKDFPGGFKEIGPHLKPGFTMYCFDFVKPGEEFGMAYNGLVYVNDHWVICPKPWRGLALDTQKK